MRKLLACGLAVALVWAVAPPSPAQDASSQPTFWDLVKQIDQALENPPEGVSPESVKSCRAMRNTAVKLYKMGMTARALRRIRSCQRLLQLY